MTYGTTYETYRQIPQQTRLCGARSGSPQLFTLLVGEKLFCLRLAAMARSRGGSTGSWTGCNLKTGAWPARCCMIAFLSCLTFALPILRPCLSLPTLVPQGYSTLFISITSDESKELITLMKAWGYSGEKASGMISIRLV